MQLTIKRSNHAPLFYGLRRKYSKIVINGSGNIHQIWHIFLLFYFPWCVKQQMKDHDQVLVPHLLIILAEWYKYMIVPQHCSPSSCHKNQLKCMFMQHHYAEFLHNSVFIGPKFYCFHYTNSQHDCINLI